VERVGQEEIGFGREIVKSGVWAGRIGRVEKKWN
jgi:hypothetical protein